MLSFFRRSNKMQAVQVVLPTLPKELWMTIFSFALETIEEWASLQLVSRAFQEYCRHRISYQNIPISIICKPGNDIYTNKICRELNAIKYLTLTFYSDTFWLDELPRLQSLKLCKSAFSLESTTMKYLTLLSFYNCSFISTFN